ncbi:MAG: type II CRISPR RNA-guided endonuclease Cas9 [Bacteroidales bacterium]|nr:type II CRISPR RNA-guided endonuclease Cas9 [Bacteroidales bacterium]
MKKILGLDLGTTSIGWALVNEAEYEDENSSIIKTGVRVIPLTIDEENDFQKGKSITINADRTLKRGVRRNLQRYKQRRNHLISLLKKQGIINENTLLTDNGKDTTFHIWELRAKAAKEQITLEDFARVLLAINKKRGYKSNRKAKDETDGQAIDGMEVAKLLYNNNLTPGQLVYQRVTEKKNHIPDFYRSDLQNEFDKVWEKQKEYYPDILTIDLKLNLEGKNKKAVWAICEKPFGIIGIKRNGNTSEQRIENYKWRVQGLSEKLELEQLAIVLQEINGQINTSSGYLGNISDRSKELYFNNQTVGQYLYKQIKDNPHTPLKNQVFYRKDYIDEFEQIWKMQSQYRKDILTEKLKEEVKDAVIFYQRKLKSQKGLISVCELEGREIEIVKGGKKKKKIVGPRVIPNSSPLFQEFKVWQILNNLKFENVEARETYPISELDNELEIRNRLFAELNFRGKLSANELLKKSIENPKTWEVKNYSDIEGNNTFASFFDAFNKIVELSGHVVSKSKPVESISKIFEILGINTEILIFNSELKGKDFEQQPSYQLWHLLYSYEGDESKSGNEKLFDKLKRKFGFEREYAKILANIVFKDDYGRLSAKAIKKILPFMKAGHEYSEACVLAGYRHSHFVLKEENDNRELGEKLNLLPKNSLRNPVVEKILNQMVNVVNAVVQHYGKPDEIRIELARELKKSAKERADMTTNISKANREHEEIKKKIQELYPFNTGVRITRNDIIKYKLYEELSFNGYRTLYTNTYIEREKLFSNEFDIEHIIPQATLFDDSFSNKTIAVRQINLEKGNKTAYDYLIEKYGGEESAKFKEYLERVEKFLSQDKQKNQAKHKKLLMKASEIPDGFIERDLRNTQYIAKKSQEMLKKIVRSVVPTTGSVTERLREDWQLINVLQELNWGKYDKLGLTGYEMNKEGKKIPFIKDWTKRNDHRHHAMDALTVAFTKHSHIQYLNYLSARNDDTHKKHGNIIAIEKKETFLNDKGKRLIKPPIPVDIFRAEAKRHLENILVSFKAKNKVVTRNINKTKKKGGEITKVVLTPRGQLHKETVYGSSSHYQATQVKVGPKFDFETIMQVAKKSHREALLVRLAENENDPQKAFGGKNSLTKNPIYLDEHQSVKLPDKIKLVSMERQFTIRKDINPDNFKEEKNIEKVIDKAQRELLKKRLREFNSDPKAAFSNLEDNPIWLVEPMEKSKWNNRENPKPHELGIKLKRVTITGVTHAEPLHTKKDHFGREIINEDGKPGPANFVSTGNNHHVAIYRDENGNLQEDVVSFYDAVARVNAGTPIIWHQHPDHPDWQFLFTMKQNEYFVFPNKETGFNPVEIDLTDENNYHLISPNLFRVQKIAKKNYVFNHHLETKAVNNDTLKNKKLSKVTYNFIQTPENLEGIVKVRLNHLGQIVKVNE